MQKYFYEETATGYIQDIECCLPEQQTSLFVFCNECSHGHPCYFVICYAKSGVLVRQPSSILAAATILSCTLLLSIYNSLGQAIPKTIEPENAGRLYEEAMALQQANHLAEARSLLLQADALSPDDVKVEIALAKLDSRFGKQIEALELFRRVESRDPKSPENAINLGIALASGGNYDEALKLATWAVELNPRASSAHYLRGKVLVDLSRGDDAQREYQLALSFSPDDPLTLYDLAIIDESMGRPAEEVALLEHLIRIRPNLANDHFLLGRALLHEGQPVKAENAFRDAVRLDPHHRAALYSLSRLLQHQDPAEAEQFTSRFRALKTTDDETNKIRDQGNSGVAAMQQHDWPSAIRQFQSALILCSGCAVESILEKDLGLAQCQSGDTIAGTASLRRSFALDPNDPDVLKAIELAEHASPRSRN